MEVKISIEDFEKEMIHRGYHITPRRCSTCGGNHGLVFNYPDERLFCVGCGRLEEKCNCR